MHPALGLLYERERAEELTRREEDVPTARPLIGVAAVRCAAHNVGVDRGVRGGNYNRAFATRLARYCARNPVALERLTYDRTAKSVSDRSDKSEGPTAGTETADPLEFLARVLVHIPDKGHFTTRYYGWYANRPRGMRRQAEPVALAAPSVIIPAPRLAPTEAARRWATLLQQVFEVDPLACPTCRGPMRIIACITQASVIDQLLTHLRSRAAHAGARSPVDARPREPRAVTRPTLAR